jgi:hypothetical protein
VGSADGTTPSSLARPERYADYGQQAVLLLERADGLIQDASAFKALVQA